MPLTEGGYPGKNISIAGHPIVFPEKRKVSYNGSLNTFAPNNPNSNEQFKVFQKDSHGVPMSQNNVLRNQDIYDSTRVNRDLKFVLEQKRKNIPTYQDRYEQLAPQQQINLERPPFTQHPY